MDVWAGMHRRIGGRNNGICHGETRPPLLPPAAYIPYSIQLPGPSACPGHHHCHRNLLHPRTSCYPKALWTARTTRYLATGHLLSLPISLPLPLSLSLARAPLPVFGHSLPALRRRRRRHSSLGPPRPEPIRSARAPRQADPKQAAHQPWGPLHSNFRRPETLFRAPSLSRPGIARLNHPTHFASNLAGQGNTVHACNSKPKSTKRGAAD